MTSKNMMEWNQTIQKLKNNKITPHGQIFDEEWLFKSVNPNATSSGKHIINP